MANLYKNGIAFWIYALRQVGEIGQKRLTLIKWCWIENEEWYSICSSFSVSELIRDRG